MSKWNFLDDWYDFVRTSPLFDSGSFISGLDEPGIREVLRVLEPINHDDRAFPGRVDEDIARPYSRGYSLSIARDRYSQCMAAIDNGLIDEAQEHASYISMFLYYVNRRQINRFAGIGRDHSGRQSIRGKAGMEKRWGRSEARKELNAIISELSKRTDALGDPLRPSELWPELYSLLEERQLDPEETEHKYVFGEDEHITYDAFRRRINRIREQD